MRIVYRWLAVGTLIIGTSSVNADDGAAGDGRLILVQAEARDDLAATVSVAVSPDGKFVYSASWQAATACVFARDPRSGKLGHRQTVSDKVLAGATTLSLSPDGRLAVATAFEAKTAILYLRDPATGELTQADVTRDGERGVRFQWPIDATFSPDSKFVYVIDDHGPRPGGRGCVVVFRVTVDKLELAGTDEGRDGCYAGARGIALHPDGKTVFVASSDANALVTAERDRETGRTKVLQVVKDGEGAARGLAGAMGVAVSPDGRSVYVSAGRFHGDNAVSAFRLGADGSLTLLNEFVDGAGSFQGFQGGNQLVVSPDGMNVYAAATNSRSVACFSRDPATGKLTYLETVADGGQGGGKGAAGVAMSPDGRFLYVATEDSKIVSVFRRAALGLARR